jgi:hypothetical protein
LPAGGAPAPDPTVPAALRGGLLSRQLPEDWPAPGDPAWYTFAVSVLAQHVGTDYPAVGRALCSCGRQDRECLIRGLARHHGVTPL